MQQRLAILALGSLVHHAQSVSPVGKVISMLSDLEAKITKEGEAAEAEYKEYTEWCEDRSRNLGFEIKTGQTSSEELKAAIAEEVATSAALSTKVEELAAGIATDTADLKAATQIRDKEATDFAAEEKELTETIDILNRAIRILEREMKGGASMVQLQHASSLAQALSAMVQASVIGTADATRLGAFIQDTQKVHDSDTDDEEAAPAAAVYESKSGSIVDTLEDLLEKAESQLADSRKKEVSASHNYEMLKQSLEDELAYANKEMEEAKKGIATSAEKKSNAEGDLDATSKELASDIATKETLHRDCTEAAEEYAATTKSRGEELKVLAEAKKAIQEATEGSSLALDQATSFLQVSRSSLESGEDLANFEAVHLVRDLARKQHSEVLAQLAQRMASVIRAGGSNPFGKVKALITDMISKLEAEAGADATKKAYCDKELKETRAKKLEKSTKIEMLTTRIDQQSAKSAKLKAEVSALQNELSKLAKAQADMDKLRLEQKSTYTAARAEQAKGLEGVKLAMKILREYYASEAAHDAASGAGGGIIGLLETIESDVTKTIASLDSEEESAAADYDTMTRRNEIDRASKEQSVKYKVKESKALDKTAGENRQDRTSAQAELDAILEYLAKIEEQCIAKAETYSERASRREAEIAGLKEALSVLESETALLQRLKKHRTLRGSALRAGQ